MDFSIGSPHKSALWYDYRLYVNLIEAMASLGINYRKNSKNRIYFLGAPRRHVYPDVGKFDPSANNLALAYCHFEKIKSYNEFRKVFLPSEFVKDAVLNDKKKHSKLFRKNVFLDNKNRIDIIRPFSSLSSTDEVLKTYECDISFIGSPRIRPIVEDIIPIVEKHNLSFQIFGPHWHEYKGNKNAVKYVTANEIPYENIPLLSSASKISLVDHHQPMNDIGTVSHKYVDLIASGAFVLSDNNKDAVQHYKGITYNSVNELEELVLFYINDENARRKQRERQLDIVQKNSTLLAAKQISQFFI
ncbi:glycosyltransferase [Alteromonas naphthalenivorans]|uniref:Spore protein YkvP/CgeB glycosyl transferase-like domain-containing protein n=1 Tax=Alteromonas naphthalenivorans TaxID=715451 RepID=F5Z662_ALTNA|nr:glycosyltransferase [Alteromonas naphthalenivorans]AEF05295.1 hypothetical protein ambt_19010 [Alteromonas naphthalenivorans]|tara:strand:+ start:1651 stop:2556 length:906 start_codon:yes stop_codon:yes gene_type:complete